MTMTNMVLCELVLRCAFLLELFVYFSVSVAYEMHSLEQLISSAEQCSLAKKCS